MKYPYLVAGFALAAAALAGAPAYALVPAQGSNYVNVASCTQDGADINIKYSTNGATTKLTSACRNAGYGLRKYTMTCVSPTRYYTSWTACNDNATPPVPPPAPPVPPQPVYIFDTMGVTIGRSGTIESNSSYLRAGNQYWAKMAGDIPATWNNLVLKLRTLPSIGSNYTYAFAWTDKAAVAGGSTYNAGTNFDETLAKNLMANVNWSSSRNLNFPITDYYRNKMVTFLAYTRNNDGVSRVPNMPTEVDDVIALHLYIPTKVVPCQDAWGNDGTYTLCDGRTLNHQWSNTKMRVIEHDEETLSLWLDGLSTNEIVLNKGEATSVTLWNNPDRYVQLMYTGLGDNSRPMLQVTSNVTANEFANCYNQSGYDATYNVCLGKTVYSQGTAMNFTVKTLWNNKVLIKANGSTKKYSYIPLGGVKYFPRVGNVNQQVKTTYQSRDGGKAVLKLETVNIY